MYSYFLIVGMFVIIALTVPVTIPTGDKSWTSTTSHMSQEYTSTSLPNTSQGNWTTSTSSITVPPSSSSSIFSSSSKATVRQTTLTSELNSTFMGSTEGIKSKTGMHSTESSDVSIAVSVSVVIVVLIAAIVIIIVLKRRGKIPSICIKSTVLDKFSKRTSDKLPTENNAYVSSPQETAYAQIDELKANNNADARQDLELSNDHYVHTYFILEPGTRESNTDTDISDSRKDNNDINDDYNTLHETVNADTKGNDTYDTTEKAAWKLKALQTARDEKESPKMLSETEEDTYHHIDRNPLKIGKTDNIYGIPNSQENDYGDVRKANNQQDEDDTYNHLKPNQ